MSIRLPYGSWPSPIPAELLVAGASTPQEVWADGGVTWWSESRPSEGGRLQIVRREADGTLRDLLPDGWSARTRVHEYGGGAWWVHSGVLFFAAWADQRLYRLGPDDPAPVVLTPPAPDHALRYADGRVTPDGETVICVRERHDDEGVTNEIVALPATGGEPRVLFQGSDFVAAPRISPDGGRLAWLSWDNPRMPWDGTELWVAGLQGSGSQTRLRQTRMIAGGDDESLVQPEWGAGGALYVVSDRSDWWNVYRLELPPDGLPPASAANAILRPVHPLAAEVSVPAWVFGQSHYVVADDAVWLAYARDGAARLMRVSFDGTAREQTLDASAIDGLHLDPTGPDGPRIVARASHGDREPEVVELPLAADDRLRVLRPARALGLPAGSVSRGREVSFPSSDGRTAHAWYYPPAGTDGARGTAGLEGLDGELPPLVVHVHGGPTAQATAAFDLETQFWTSRGVAVVDVNYGGSTGYGRPYRRLLDGAWGIVDVQDCCAAAQWLADSGLADKARMAISGGSAGGFTVLACLALTDTFSAGASHFGVADLAALAADTHKFEARYLDRLVGPLPEAAAVYRERSPLSHVDGFDAPLIVLQGLEDQVVPPAQAEAIVAALAAKGVPHAYLPFEGEQHGFRLAANIIRAVTAELSFYGQVFGFEPAGAIEPVRITGVL